MEVQVFGVRKSALVRCRDPAARHDAARAPGGAETQYGFRWFVDTYRNERRWRHTGETSGFRNAIQRFPDRRFTVIVLTNRNGGEPAAIAERIADGLLFGETR